MPLSPAALMMLRRKGPGMGPMQASSVAGGAPGPSATGGAPGGDGGSQIGQALEKLMAELHGGDAEGSYIAKVISDMKRNTAVLVAKTDQSHPEVQRHLARALTALDAALKATKQSIDNKSNQSVAGPPLGFSGAMAPEQADVPGPGGMMNQAGAA